MNHIYQIRNPMTGELLAEVESPKYPRIELKHQDGHYCERCAGLFDCDGEALPLNRDCEVADVRR